MRSSHTHTHTHAHTPIRRRFRQRAFAIVKEIVEAHNGDCVEETLWVFYNNSDAFAATLEVKAAIVDYNEVSAPPGLVGTALAWVGD